MVDPKSDNSPLTTNWYFWDGENKLYGCELIQKSQGDQKFWRIECETEGSPKMVGDLFLNQEQSNFIFFPPDGPEQKLEPNRYNIVYRDRYSGTTVTTSNDLNPIKNQISGFDLDRRRTRFHRIFPQFRLGIGGGSEFALGDNSDAFLITPQLSLAIFPFQDKAGLIVRGGKDFLLPEGENHRSFISTYAAISLFDNDNPRVRGEFYAGTDINFGHHGTGWQDTAFDQTILPKVGINFVIPVKKDEGTTVLSLVLYLETGFRLFECEGASGYSDSCGCENLQSPTEPASPNTTQGFALNPGAGVLLTFHPESLIGRHEPKVDGPKPVILPKPMKKDEGEDITPTNMEEKEEHEKSLACFLQNRFAIDVGFKFDSDDLEPETKGAVGAISKIIYDTLKQTPDWHKHIDKLVVHGYASEEGSSDYNLALSEKRAKAIAAELTRELNRRGIKDVNIEVEYHGADSEYLKPTREESRRVEIEIIMKPQIEEMTK